MLSATTLPALGCVQDNQDGTDSHNARVFVLLLTMYMYTSAAGTFCPIPSMAIGVPLQMYNANKALQLIDKDLLLLVYPCLICLSCTDFADYQTALENIESCHCLLFCDQDPFGLVIYHKTIVHSCCLCEYEVWMSMVRVPLCMYQ